jgi:hypothetical protein
MLDSVGDDITETQQICMPYIRYFNSYDKSDAIDWLYEDGGFTPDNIKRCSLLSVTNADVDAWNTLIQERNTTQELPTKLSSHDILADVDDEHGYLAKCLPTYVLNDFNNSNKAPPHELFLKVSYYLYQYISLLLISVHTAFTYISTLYSILYQSQFFHLSLCYDFDTSTHCYTLLLLIAVLSLSTSHR